MRAWEVWWHTHRVVSFSSVLSHKLVPGCQEGLALMRHDLFFSYSISVISTRHSSYLACLFLYLLLFVALSCVGSILYQVTEWETLRNWTYHPWQGLVSVRLMLRNRVGYHVDIAEGPWVFPFLFRDKQLKCETSFVELLKNMNALKGGEGKRVSSFIFISSSENVSHCMPKLPASWRQAGKGILTLS